MSKERLIVFVKAPRPGTVKTRLGLGPDAECAAYQRLVTAVLGKIASFKEVELRFTPPDAGPEVEPWLRKGWQTTPQGDGDLGARMQAAFADAFSAEAKRVLIIGSDCPYLEAQDIRIAWKALKTSNLVLGPAKDGGYWLIGLREMQTALFKDMRWSSNTVFTETIACAKTVGLKTFLLRTLSDVDTREDWEKFIAAEGRVRKRCRSPAED